MGRASRPVLARCRALRRHQRLSLRQLPRSLGLSRLGDRRVQPRSSVRPVHDRATGRRPVAGPHPRPGGRLGVQPLQRDDQRGRRHPRGVQGPVCPRPHRDGLHGLDGADRRLRRLPRPQVRPDLAARVLRTVGVLRQHDAAGDGRQRAGHAAHGLRAGRGRPPWLGGALRRAEARPGRSRRPQDLGPARVRPLAGRGEGRRAGRVCPRRGAPADRQRPRPETRPHGPRHGSRRPTPATSRRTMRSPTGPGSSCRGEA